MEDMEELIEVMLECISQIESTPELCEQYPKICAYASSKAWKRTLAERMAAIVVKTQNTNAFHAATQVELALNENE